MIGIYKITNKINGKSYIGQSIHCGKRFDEHYKGAQLIDQIIQKEGLENFSFEILEECRKEELNEKEDHYIEKYNTLYPNGYNKRWNISKKKVKQSSLNNTDLVKNREKEIPEEMSREIIQLIKNDLTLKRVYLLLLKIFELSKNGQEILFSQKDILDILKMDSKNILNYHKILKCFSLLSFYQIISIKFLQSKSYYKLQDIKEIKL